MDSPWTSNKSNVITAEDLNLAFGAMQQIQETQVHAIAPPALVCRSRTAASPKARPESKELEMENIAMLQLSNGALYEGHLEDFKAHGRGLLCYASGNRYDGDFVLDQAHGYGCFLWKDGSIYEGQWSRNLQDGIGKEIWSDGSGFEGSFRQGKKSGVGKVWWPEGCYEGDIDGGELEGQGTLTWKDGTSYCGGWV